MIEQHLYTALASSGVTAFAANRIYPLLLPTEPTLPAVTYSIIAATSDPTFETAGLNKYRVQIDCWGSSYNDATYLRDLVVATLDGYTDVNMTAWKISAHDGYAEDLLQYIATIDFYILSAL